MHDIFGEYRVSFLEETEEHLEKLNGDLIAFEKNPHDTHLIDNIFRIMHTLKSSAAAVGMESLSEFAHKTEDLIQQFRSGTLKVNEDVIDTLFTVFDQFKSYIELAWEDRETEINFTPLIQRIHTFYQKEEKTKAIHPKKMIEEDTFTLSTQEKRLIRKENRRLFLVHIQIDSAEQMKWLRAELILNHMNKIGKIIRIIPEKAYFQSNQFTGHFSVVLTTGLKSAEVKKAITIDLVKMIRIDRITNIDSPITHHVKYSPVRSDTISPNIQKSDSNSSGRRMTAENSIRVPIKKLDDLMHLVGELVVANSGLKLLEKRMNESFKNESLVHEMNALNDKLIKVSADLQKSVLTTRMLPVDTIFNQYIRVVRDLSKKENKDIDLIIMGRETEVDKKVIDAMHDPLTHLIRNAVDHGIETPEERIRNNKPQRARIELSAQQAGNHILITIKDDGRGIDLEKVKNRAIQQGFISSDMAQTITKNELLNILFQQGFSTSDKVSSMSGRGVGLDVVSNMVNRLNGSVNVQTSIGKGTEFEIILPLTLTIITVIVAESNGHRYGIPVNDIRKSIKIPEKDIENRECVCALNLGNRVIPVIGINDVLDNGQSQLKVDKHGLVPIIVISYAEKEVGLIVDRILGKQEIVLKSLEKNYRSIQGLSGAAILGDGSIILVIDTLRMIQIYSEQNKMSSIKEVCKEVE